jgi:hypothetical protein
MNEIKSLRSGEDIVLIRYSSKQIRDPINYCVILHFHISINFTINHLKVTQKSN